MSTLTKTVTGRSMTIAAVVNQVDGAPDGAWQGDWAAYWGPGAWTVQECADRGDKLPEAMARTFWPFVDLPYRS